MASLKQTTEQLTETLDGLVGQVRKELENGDVDFQLVARLAVREDQHEALQELRALLAK